MSTQPTLTPEEPMSLDRVEYAIKEAYKAAKCGSWEEAYYFDGLLTMIFVRRDTEERRAA